MTSGAPKPLNAAQTQAAREWQQALWALQDIRRVNAAALSPEARRSHNNRQAEAHRRCDAARLGMAALLEEDS
jgi:hypothetical protein